MSYPIGTRVVIVRSPTPKRIGTVTTVIGTPRPMTPVLGSPWYGVIAPMTLVQELDLPTLPEQSGPEWEAGNPPYPPAWLEPYRPDHNEKASWTDLDDWVRKACFSGAEEEAG